MAEKQTKREKDVESFIERKLNTLNAVSRDGRRSAKAERAMARVIAKNRGVK